MEPRPSIINRNYHAIYEYNNKTKERFDIPLLAEENFDHDDGRFSLKINMLGTNATYLEEDKSNQVYVISPSSKY